MARAEHLAFTLAALVSLVTTAAGARYGGSDYVVHMPVYGDDEPAPPDRDDYPAHLPEGPAAPDYNIKYEEESKDKTDHSFGAEVNERNSWRRLVRKPRKKSDDIFRVDDLDKFESDDDFPKKSSNRFTKHRPRHKDRRFEGHVEERPRLLKRPVRDRSDDVPQIDEDVMPPGNERFLDDSSSLQSKKERFAYRSSSVRPRRRPRDKYERPRTSDHDEVHIGESDRDRSLDLWPLDKDKEFLDRRLVEEEAPLRSRDMPSLRPIAPDSGEDEEPPLVRSFEGRKEGRHNYENYDYYDMKRAMNIKNKLPAARRTQERHGLVPAPLPRSSTALLANRRLLPDTTRRHIAITTTTTTTTEATISTSHIRIFPLVVSLTTTATPNVSKELSIAEKSRLSILKKAQRKDSGRSDQLSKKPPVLMQVTQRLQTVLMVEPPTTIKLWMRASPVSDDSPLRLQKVKRLMRQKLLSNARSIQDLTDNWDELVCDYVDMSLLQNTAHVNTPGDYYIVMLIALLYV